MERGYTIHELWRAARRRLVPATIVASAAFAMLLAVILLLPGEYRAQTILILEPHRAHPELITPSTTALFEDRLRVARQHLVATPLLERVVREVNPYPELTAKEGIDAAVAMLRRHLEVHPDGESAVMLAYRTRHREKAAPVVAALARGFVESNAEVRTAQSQRVLEIISEELDAVSQALAVQEEKVAAYRREHDGELPEQVESNLREAERGTRLLESAENYVRDLERRRTLARTAPSSPEVARYTEIESELERRLNHARSLFQEDHPEPIRLGRELEGIRGLKEEALGREHSTQRQIAALGREIARAREEARVLDERIQEARRKAAAGAQRGGELGLLERDRDALREKYRSLLSRKVESEVALGLEMKSAPLSTRVVDPPVEPGKPSSPDRPQFAFLALLFSLGLGVSAGVVMETRDRTLRTPEQTRAQLDLPLLAALPSLKATPGKSARKR